MFELRDYQTRAVSEVRAELSKGRKSVVMVLSTGGGKSAIFAEIIRLAVEKGNTVLWMVHRRNLVRQMVDTLAHHGVSCGIIMAGEESDLAETVQVCTVQTYVRRLQLDELERNRFFIPASVVMIDEAHCSVSPRYKKIIDLYGDKVVIGCTATPVRGDGRGLGDVFESLVDVAGVQELTAGGYLVPVRYFAPTTIDTKGIKVVRGDYDNKQLAEKCDTAKITGDVIENWLKIAGGRKTIIFAVNVKHSIHLRDAFRAVGVGADHLDARSSDDERDAVFERMEKGETKVICNVAIYQEGMDVPEISCVVMARPTKSLGLYRQCCGRGLRTADGKDDLLVLDHGGNVERLGFLDDEVEWSLDSTKQAAKLKKKSKKERRQVTCSACGLVFNAAPACPDCQTPVENYGKDVDVDDADLEELKPKTVNRTTDWGLKRMFMGALRWYCKQKGYKDGWAVHSYKDFFGVWPNDERVKYAPAIKPEGEVEMLLKHILIKKAKAYQKQQAKERYAEKDTV